MESQYCRKEGGILHVHGNAKDSEEYQWTDHVSKSIYEIARSEGIIFSSLILKISELHIFDPVSLQQRRSNF